MQRSRLTSPRAVRETFLSFQPPAVDEEEIEAVAETLRSGLADERAARGRARATLRRATGARHAVAVSSGTAAMHLALVAAGIGPGDEVITSPITWPATANVIVHTGARPIFCDVRDSDLNIDAALLPGVATRAHPGGHAGRPRRPAVRPRPDPALARERGWLVDRGRRPRGRGDVPGPARSARSQT